MNLRSNALKLIINKRLAIISVFSPPNFLLFEIVFNTMKHRVEFTFLFRLIFSISFFCFIYFPLLGLFSHYFFLGEKVDTLFGKGFGLELFLENGVETTSFLFFVGDGLLDIMMRKRSVVSLFNFLAISIIC